MNEPKDYEYLLLCDGSTISEENYPELVAVLGGTQLPNLIDRFLQGAATAGTYKTAGLPNIEGWAYMNGNGSWNTTKDNGGAFAYKNGYNPTTLPETTSQVYYPTESGYTMRKYFSIDASLSSSIYGNSNTVQPPAYTAKIYICYAG